MPWDEQGKWISYDAWRQRMVEKGKLKPLSPAPSVSTAPTQAPKEGLGDRLRNWFAKLGVRYAAEPPGMAGLAWKREGAKPFTVSHTGGEFVKGFISPFPLPSNVQIAPPKSPAEQIAGMATGTVGTYLSPAWRVGGALAQLAPAASGAIRFGTVAAGSELQRVLGGEKVTPKEAATRIGISAAVGLASDIVAPLARRSIANTLAKYFPEKLPKSLEKAVPYFLPAGVGASLGAARSTARIAGQWIAGEPVDLKDAIKQVGEETALSAFIFTTLAALGLAEKGNTANYYKFAKALIQAGADKPDTFAEIPGIPGIQFHYDPGTAKVQYRISVDEAPRFIEQARTLSAIAPTVPKGEAPKTTPPSTAPVLPEVAKPETEPVEAAYNTWIIVRNRTIGLEFDHPGYKSLFDLGRNIAEGNIEYDVDEHIRNIQQSLALPADVDVRETARAYYKRIVGLANKLAESGQTDHFMAPSFTQSDVVRKGAEVQPATAATAISETEMPVKVGERMTALRKRTGKEYTGIVERVYRGKQGQLLADMRLDDGTVKTIPASRKYTEWKLAPVEVVPERAEKPTETVSEAKVIETTPEAKIEAPKTASEQPQAKEPWQMTQAEYDKWLTEGANAARVAAGHRAQWDNEVYGYAKGELIPVVFDRKGAALEAAKSLGPSYIVVKKAEPRGPARWFVVPTHRAIVEKALQQGKPVPPEVLNDYPDLVARVKPEAKAEHERELDMPKLEWGKQAPDYKSTLQSFAAWKRFLEEAKEVAYIDQPYGHKVPVYYYKGQLVRVGPSSSTSGHRYPVHIVDPNQYGKYFHWRNRQDVIEIAKKFGAEVRAKPGPVVSDIEFGGSMQGTLKKPASRVEIVQPESVTAKPEVPFALKTLADQEAYERGRELARQKIGGSHGYTEVVHGINEVLKEHGRGYEDPGNLTSYWHWPLAFFDNKPDTPVEQIIDAMEGALKGLGRALPNSWDFKPDRFYPSDMTVSEIRRIKSLRDSQPGDKFFDDQVEQLIYNEIKRTYPHVRKGSKRYNELRANVLDRAREIIAQENQAEAARLVPEVKNRLERLLKSIDEAEERLQFHIDKALDVLALRPESQVAKEAKEAANKILARLDEIRASIEADLAQVEPSAEAQGPIPAVPEVKSEVPSVVEQPLKPAAEAKVAPTAEVPAGTVPQPEKEAPEVQKAPPGSPKTTAQATGTSDSLESVLADNLAEVQRNVAGESERLYAFAPGTAPRGEIPKAPSETLEQVLTATKTPRDWVEAVKRKFAKFSSDLAQIFSYHPELDKYPRLKNALRIFEGVGADADEFATRALVGVVGDLQTPDRYEVFRRLVVLNDLIETAEQGLAVPRGVPTEELIAYRDQLMAQADDLVRGALDRHYKLMKGIGEELVRRGKLSPESLRDKYYPHRVLDYIEEVDRRVGMPRKLRTPYRFYTKERVGSLRDIDTAYLEIMYQHLCKVYVDNATDDFMMKVAKMYDLREVQPEKFKEITSRVKLRPGMIVDVDGQPYRAWQYDRGNLLFPTQTIAESVVRLAMKEGITPQELLGPYFDEQGKFLETLERALEEGTEILPEVQDFIDRAGEPFRTVLALGHYKRIYLLPEEVADTLNNLRTGRQLGKVLNSLITANRLWKRVTLSTLGIPFQLGNLTGDLINLFREDPAAIRNLIRAIQVAAGELPQGYQRLLKTLKILGEQAVPEAEETLRLAREQRVLEAGFTGRGIASIYTEPLLARVQPQKAMLHVYNPLSIVEILSDLRESIPRLAKFITDLERIRSGKQVVAKAVDIEGLEPVEAAGKVAREALVDYRATSTDVRIIRDLLFPFITFYLENFRNWYRYVRRYQFDFLLKFGIPLGAMWLWNNFVQDEQEKRLPDYWHYIPHICTGYTTEDGKDIIIGLQTPVDIAARMVGLDRLPDKVAKVIRGEMTVQQAALEQLKDMGLAPIRAATYLLSPLIRVIVELAANKDAYGRTIVPERLQGTRQGNELMARHVLESIIEPYAQYITAIEQPEPGEALWRTLRRGPLDIERALGIRKIDVAGQQRRIMYETAEEGTQAGKQMKADLEDAFIEAIDKNDLNIFRQMLAKYPTVTSETVKNIMTSPRIWAEICRRKMAKAKTPEEHEKWKRWYDYYRMMEAVEALKRIPKAVREQMAKQVQ